MPHKFPIGDTTCGNEKSQVYVKYYFKTRQISLLTVIDTVEKIFLMAKTMKQWSAFPRVFCKFNGSFILMVFLKEFIRIVLITDSVLFSIGATELMKFQNKIEQHGLSN